MDKILIEVRGGTIQRIAATKYMQIIIVDWDNIDAGDKAVNRRTIPDKIVKKGEFYQIFDETTPAEAEVREDLKRIHF